MPTRILIIAFVMLFLANSVIAEDTNNYYSKDVGCKVPLSLYDDDDEEYQNLDIGTPYNQKSSTEENYKYFLPSVQQSFEAFSEASKNYKEGDCFVFKNGCLKEYSDFQDIFKKFSDIPGFLKKYTPQTIKDGDYFIFKDGRLECLDQDIINHMFSKKN